MKRQDDPDGQRRINDLMRNKMMGSTNDKADYISHLCRASSATRVVEAGTRFGLSTIYLALAVGRNASRLCPEQRKDAKVIATENEPSKATMAHRHWREAGEEVESWIELREGDIRQILASEPAGEY